MGKGDFPPAGKATQVSAVSSEIGHILDENDRIMNNCII